MNTQLTRQNRRGHPRRGTAQAGFSLAELMVVIVIIGLLATLVAPRAIDFLKRAFGNKAEIDIYALESAVEDYVIQNSGKYPESLDSLVIPDENGYRYLKQMKIPKDPWGTEYQYEPPYPGHPDPRIYTLGADGAPGGEGENKDISNIQLHGGEE
jgi:general secretion pathway protein G